jgi:short-subunit dehydrogenase
MNLKPIEEQVMVITGATSGIGLVTARMAADRGAKLVLAARNQRALDTLENKLKSKDVEVVTVKADVAVESDVVKIASEALAEFGNFDTWVNNAGVSIYGNLEDVSLEDSKKLFDTNFWGTVNGSLVAARNLKINGGALVNVGSVLSDRAIPVQGMYCASKHAVKGFTDALRMELEAENAPISVTLVKPSAIDTPYKEHAKSYLKEEPQNPPPVYSPETVAKAILHCAEHPVRDVVVGGGGRTLAFLGSIVPRSTDVVMENTMIEMQRDDELAGQRKFESLYEPNDDRLRERGGYEGHVAESSLYTQATLHPVFTGALVAAGVGGVLFALNKATRQNGNARLSA